MAKSVGEEARLAIENLSPFIPAYGRHAIIQRLLEKYQAPSTETESSVSKAYHDIAMKLYEIVEGGYYADDIIKDLIESYRGADQAVVQDIRGFTRFTVVDNSAYSNIDILNQRGTLEDINLGKEAGLNTSVSNPARESSNLVAIEMMDPDLGLAARDSSSVSIFTSLIPTLELSRCIPYINIRLTTSGSNSEQNTLVTRPSLSTFLRGFGSKLTPGEVGNLGYSSYVGENSETHPSSMEIFLSPQTMTPSPDSQAFSERGNVPVVLDRFRPFMSLKGLSFSVVPSKGFMSYKSGKMEITLHDRSRLREISSLVTPGVYQETEFDIEYGWSHPEGDSSKNSFGAFLNGLKVREKYGVVNSTFAFGDSGQVDISVNIAMKGAKTIESVDISGRESLTKELDGIISELSERMNGGDLSNSDRQTSIFGETIIEAISTSDNSVSLSAEKVKEIRTRIAKLEKSSVSEEIIGPLRSVFGEGGKIDENQKCVDELIRSSFEDVRKKELFPFCNESSRNKIPKLTQGTVSFGNLLLHFIGKPLAKTRQFEEVQFIFHPMNHKASWMRNLSIAKFPIDISGQDVGFEKRLKEFLKENLKMSSAQFFNFLSSEFISDPSASAYGMHDFFEQKLDSDGNPTGEYEKKEQYEGADGIDEEEKRLEAAGINDGKLIYVKPEMYPECVPYTKDPSKTILRLHVVDSACKSYNTLYELLRSTRLNDISTFGIEDDNPSNLWSDSDAILCPEYSYLRQKKESLFKLIEDSRITRPLNKEQTPPAAASATTPPNQEVSADDPSKSSKIEDDVGKIIEGKSLTEVKKFISEGMPTIYYGSSGGAITNIGVSSLADSKLATVNIINMTKTSAEAPDADRNRNLPLFVMPTTCTVDMIGCPILQYGQFFFLDLKTGTTADNMYWVTGLDHKLGPEGFTTSAKLTLVDAYGGYRNPARKLDLLSGALAKKFGISLPERKGSGGGARKGTIDFDMTKYLGLDKLTDQQALELNGKVVMAVLDKNFNIMKPSPQGSARYSPLIVKGDLSDPSPSFFNEDAEFVIEVILPYLETAVEEAAGPLTTDAASATIAATVSALSGPYVLGSKLFIWKRADFSLERREALEAVGVELPALTQSSQWVDFETVWEGSQPDQKAANNFSASISRGKKPLVQFENGDWYLSVSFKEYLTRLNDIKLQKEEQASKDEENRKQIQAAKNAEAEEKRKADAAAASASSASPLRR